MQGVHKLPQHMLYMQHCYTLKWYRYQASGEKHLEWMENNTVGVGGKQQLE